MNYRVEFEIKEDHLKLLKRFYVSWRSCEFGAPSIDCKRPYGNGDVVRDICFILGWIKGKHDEVPDNYEEKAVKIHKEMETVLQIVLCTQRFEAGTYINEEKHISLGWEKLKI